MSDKSPEDFLGLLSVVGKNSYQSNKVNKGVVSVGSPRTLKDSGYNNYIKARVDKLRDLYEKLEPEYTYQWILPEGETDGRKAVKTEFIVGEAISPFDLEDFEDIMPKQSDFVKKYRD